jgi:MoaA/NifB/PqqE/SkfB family radical SAM enzyme
MKDVPISLAYALSWKCYFNCPICLSGIEGNEDMITTVETWKKTVEPLLNHNGSVRLTLTGGEPMFFWDKTDELLEFIKYLHESKIHICLNTTGINLTREKLEVLDKYLDTILLSVRGLTVETVRREFNINEEQAKKLRDTQMMILREIHNTDIRLEVSTVVTKENISSIEYLGGKLCAINNNIIWRVDEYYRNGKQCNRSEGEYDLEAAQYDAFMINLCKKYSHMIFIRHSSREGRVHAPDPFLFPDGNLHGSSGYSYKLICPVREYDFKGIKTRRDWSTYLNSLRNWGWECDDYHNQLSEDIYTKEKV